MKKILLSFVLFASTSFAFAQNNFENAMAGNISKLEATNKINDLDQIASEFDRLTVQKDSWLPYYYASYTFVKKGKALLQANKTEEVNGAIASAFKYAMVAKQKEGNSAEISILMKMIHSLKMRVAPEKSYKEENALGMAEIKNATSLDAKNPRITIALADDLYYLPTEYGGNKEQAIQLYKTAVDQFKNYKAKTALSPNWGKEEAMQMISGTN
ncbi:hypothetical protein [Frigoriflavimonas asaccharolytica]|uniref:Tetratricopeptide repeat protein n=1 Tax=Frigoriflavimonas asaccharolytica TaxID=2735899 RepID=A0A8J8KA68_9FLAO|nr:hypothetical protein [Frigoriflavimonas asaccharolytica]NRS91159.1 hypothetical protein [Frigoriflavimonas asaccharolytica]